MRDRTPAGEGQRERETQNLKQVPGSELSAQSPTRGSNPPTARSRPEPKSVAQLTEPSRHPLNTFERQSKRVSTSRGRVGREGDTESEAGSRLRAVTTETKAGLEPKNLEVMTCVEVRHLTD